MTARSWRGRRGCAPARPAQRQPMLPNRSAGGATCDTCPWSAALPTPDRATPYLAVKQDNNDDTFLISPAPIPGIDEDALTAETPGRDIGDGHPRRTTSPTQPRSDHPPHNA
jgi:hypothetical protein